MFPDSVFSEAVNNGESHTIHGGITLRQLYAGMIMAGICTTAELLTCAESEIADRAINLADALIAAESAGGES